MKVSVWCVKKVEQHFFLNKTKCNICYIGDYYWWYFGFRLMQITKMYIVTIASPSYWMRAQNTCEKEQPIDGGFGNEIITKIPKTLQTRKVHTYELQSHNDAISDFKWMKTWWRPHLLIWIRVVVESNPTIICDFREIFVIKLLQADVVGWPANTKDSVFSCMLWKRTLILETTLLHQWQAPW